MRAQTKNEQRLLWLVGAMVLVMITIYGLGALSRTQAGLNAEYRRVRLQQVDGRSLVSEADTWTERTEWLAVNAPRCGEEGKTRAEVLEHGLQEARDNHMQILEQSLGDVQRTAEGVSVSAKFRATGTMEQVCRCLSALQNPRKFYAVTSLSLRAGETDQVMICSITLKRFFKP